MVEPTPGVAVALAADAEVAAMAEEPEQKSAMGAFLVRLAGKYTWNRGKVRSEMLILFLAYLFVRLNHDIHPRSNRHHCSLRFWSCTSFGQRRAW